MINFRKKLSIYISKRIFECEGISVPHEEIEKLIKYEYKEYDLSVNTIALINLVKKYE